MDPVTHAFTGALLSEAGFRQRLGNRSRPVIIAAAMLPDIDIIYRIQGLPSYIANHRGFSHSFLGVLGAGLVLGTIMGRLDEERRYLAWIAALCVALFSHQILDLITSYGTVLLYPFDSTRFYFDWVFIIDIWLSGTLLLFTILSRRRPNGERLAQKGLLLVAGYIAFCAVNHELALYQLRESARQNQITYRSVAAIPQPPYPLQWSGIIDAGQHYYRVTMNSFASPELDEFQPFTKATGSLYEQIARSTEMGVLYFWFARYPVVQESIDRKDHVVEFYDLRFYRVKIQGLQMRTPFVLRIKMDAAGNILETRFSRS